MKITDLINQLNTIHEQHGDLDVVNGFGFCGYGAPVTSVEVVTAKTIEDDDLKVVDFEISQEAIVAIDGF